VAISGLEIAAVMFAREWMEHLYLETTTRDEKFQIFFEF
jgi:hypothetical protein